jgi:hypothetical protein
LQRLRGRISDSDQVERISTAACFDHLQVPMNLRNSGTARRLCLVMTQLGWTPTRVKGVTAGGYAEDIRGYARHTRPERRARRSSALLSAPGLARPPAPSRDAKADRKPRDCAPSTTRGCAAPAIRTLRANRGPSLHPQPFCRPHLNDKPDSLTQQFGARRAEANTSEPAGRWWGRTTRPRRNPRRLERRRNAGPIP